MLYVRNWFSVLTMMACMLVIQPGEVYGSVCTSGTHREDCDYTCDNCNGQMCDSETGVCIDGCQIRWQGSKCDECEDGFYGDRCQFVCGHCLGIACSQDTSECPTECQTGWAGRTCDEHVCAPGTYGDHCENTCDECLTSVCDPQTGQCAGGCKEGWMGSRCDDLPDQWITGLEYGEGAS